MSDSFGAQRDQYVLNSDEKLFALFSHLSYFFGGIILPIIFWVVNKDKSKFAAFHSLQALWFHVAVVAIFLVVVLIFVIAALALGLFAAGSGSKEPSLLFIIVMVAFYGFLIVVALGAMVYSVIMGIKSYKGEYAKYPIIGKMVYNKVYGTGA